jgi:multimeric flavodoxin WrbA
MVKVLGVSGSIHKDSNTDTLIKTIVKSTGMSNELIKLSNVKVGSCIGCKACHQNLECALNDDFKWISKKMLNADAIIVGSPVMCAAVSSITKAFIERWNSFIHVEPPLLKGKLAASVIIGWSGVKMTNEWLTKVALEGMGGMNVVGSVTAQGYHSSFTCGNGESCPRSAWNILKKFEIMLGQDIGFEKMCKDRVEELPDNDPFKNPSYKLLDSSYLSVKNQPEVMQKADEIGKLIANKIS